MQIEGSPEDFPIFTVEIRGKPNVVFHEPTPAKAPVRMAEWEHWTAEERATARVRPATAPEIKLWTAACVAAGIEPTEWRWTLAFVARPARQQRRVGRAHRQSLESPSSAPRQPEGHRTILAGLLEVARRQLARVIGSKGFVARFWPRA